MSEPVFDGEMARAARRRLGLTAQQVAARLGDVTHWAIYKWEQGAAQPPAEIAARLAVIYGLTDNPLLTTPTNAAGSGDAA